MDYQDALEASRAYRLLAHALEKLGFETESKEAHASSRRWWEKHLELIPDDK